MYITQDRPRASFFTNRHRRDATPLAYCPANMMNFAVTLHDPHILEPTGVFPAFTCERRSHADLGFRPVVNLSVITEIEVAYGDLAFGMRDVGKAGEGNKGEIGPEGEGDVGERYKDLRHQWIVHLQPSQDLPLLLARSPSPPRPPVSTYLLLPCSKPPSPPSCSPTARPTTFVLNLEPLLNAEPFHHALQLIAQ
ncbi:hypothetical protein Hypma_004234 [Hypsizygus marmoreus]|uniref:Uncharacterized protein n=1 Tax=Hypsizygus marmoreus TaxID=39966 RepID=A0A369J219_HYPMA|nr:hypothetical protein Hypma_004234 [Hypsizygus marmoreus]